MTGKVVQAGGFIWIFDEPVRLRVKKGAQTSTQEPGECVGSGMRPSSTSHAHPIALTAVQMALVADEDFIRAYYEGIRPGIPA